jgi:hypothetical protein
MSGRSRSEYAAQIDQLGTHRGQALPYWMPRITAAMGARPLPGRMVWLPAAQGAAPEEEETTRTETTAVGHLAA